MLDRLQAVENRYEKLNELLVIQRLLVIQISFVNIQRNSLIYRKR